MRLRNPEPRHALLSQLSHAANSVHDTQNRGGKRTRPNVGSRDPRMEEGVGAALERHALALDLRDPRLDALLRLVGLVVLVARKANELVAHDRLALHVVVAVRAPRADDVGAALLEAGLQLVHGVAEVVAVAALVAQAEDGHLLALEVKALEVAVDEVIPRRARALGVGAGVPRRGADDDAVVARHVLARQVANVHRIEARRLSDVSGDRLGVASG